MFYHKTCGGAVYADLRNHLKVLGVISLGKNVGLINRMHFQSVGDVSEGEYICSGCGEKVSIPEINTMCNQCREMFSSEKMVKLVRSGVLVCNSCKAEKYPLEESKPVARMLAKVSTKQI